MSDASTPDDILSAAERYCADGGIKLSTLGLYAVGNSRFFANLKAGRPCLTSTLDRVRWYMVNNPRAASGDGKPKHDTVNAVAVITRDDAA